MGRFSIRCLGLTLLLGLATSPATAQSEGDMPMDGQHQHHATIVGPGAKLGRLSFPNSANLAAQEPFLRGVKLLHNFQYPNAIVAFQEAQKADPGFALAYWGEAMAHNYTLWAEQHLEAARTALAKLGPTPETRAAKATTPREKAWLGAVEALYGKGTKFERDAAYADRMDALHTAYPSDLEAQVFDALATLGRSHGTRDTAGYMKGAALLEELFPTHRDHPGVVHYLIHAYDDPAHAPLGMRAARLYDQIAPDSPHAQHMTSHIFLALGMWPEVERSNRASLAVSEVRMKAHGVPLSRLACGHVPNWLTYALLQEGKDAAAEIGACGAAAMAPAALAGDKTVTGAANDATDYTDMVLRQGIETGRWPGVIALPEGHLALAHFNLAYAHVLGARHDARAASTAVEEMRQTRAEIQIAMKAELPDDDQTLPWLDRAVVQGEAIAMLAKGDRDGGLTALKACVAAEVALPPPFGPPALQKPSAELLGDELLALGRNSDAAAAYRSALTAAPGRRLAMIGLKAAESR